MPKEEKWQKENREQLEAGVFDGYEFIPKLIKKTPYYKWDHIKVEGNCLTITKIHVPIIEISWSWNEQKIYFTSGVCSVRLIGDEWSLQKALEALDLIEPVFNRMVSAYEM